MKEFISTLNWVDWLIVACFLRGAVVGYKDGLLAEFLRVFVYSATFFCAKGLTPFVAPVMEEHLSLDGEILNMVTTAVLAIASFLILRVSALILLKVVKTGEGFVFNVLGLVVGMLRWAMVLSIAFMIVDRVHVTALYEDIGEKSRLAPSLIPIAPTVYDYVTTVLPTYLPTTPAIPATPA